MGKEVERHGNVPGFRSIVENFNDPIGWWRVPRGSWWISGHAKPDAGSP